MLIQHEGGFLDLVYEPQFSSLPLDKIVSVRASSWEVLKNLSSVNNHQVHFNQHEQVWPFTGFSTLHMIATELQLEGQGHLIDYLPIDHTPKAMAYQYRMFREFPYWSQNPEEDREISGFVYPEDIEQMREWLSGGDTGVISGYLLPLFHIPEGLIKETLGGEEIA